MRPYNFLSSCRNGVFWGHTLMCLGFDLDQIKRRLRNSAGSWLNWIVAESKTVRDHIDSGCAGFVLSGHLRGRKYNLLWIRSWSGSSHDHVVLAHEVVHLCQFVLPDFIDRGREIEAEAYHHTYFMEEFLKLVESNTKTKTMSKTKTKPVRAGVHAWSVRTRSGSCRYYWAVVAANGKVTTSNWTSTRQGRNAAILRALPQNKIKTVHRHGRVKSSPLS